MRLSNGILLFLVLTVIAGGGAWPASSYTQEAEWTKSKESALRSLTAPASFFDGSPEEVAARVDNLLLLHEDPAEQTVGHGARGPVNKSSKQYHAYSPDLDQAFRLTLSCTSSCLAMLAPFLAAC